MPDVFDRAGARANVAMHFAELAEHCKGSALACALFSWVGWLAFPASVQGPDVATLSKSLPGWAVAGALFEIDRCAEAMDAVGADAAEREILADVRLRVKIRLHGDRTRFTQSINDLLAERTIEAVR